jgi:hypothetical protein
MNRLPGRLLFCLFLLWCFATGLSAQEFKAAYPGTGVIQTTGNWRFHTSDDMAWANPALDDSGWETITANDTWGAQTHPSHTGYAWYRRAFEIDGITGPLSLAMPPVDDVYEVYWNGQLIGGRGSMPPHGNWNTPSVPDVIDLPKPDAHGSLKGVLVLRVWKATLASLDPSTLGGMNGPPTIGDTKVLHDRLRLAGALSQQHALILIMESAILFLTGCFAVWMWARDRHTKLYLWLGLFLVAASGYGVLPFTAFQRAVTLQWLQLFIQLISSTQDISMWMLVVTLFGLDKEKLWRRTTAVAAALYISAQIVDTVVLFFWGNAGHGIQLTDGITTTVYSVVPLYIFVLLAFGLRRKWDRSLLPMALACALMELFTMVNGGLAQGQRFTHIDIGAVLRKATIHIGDGYVLGLRGQISALLLVVFMWTVIRQQINERRRQEKVEAEVKSAREVQQVLVPEDVPPVPGYAISSLYWPAEEVGGDLFQIIPGSDGDVLVVLADVSGKGLKAAMTVSLMVGTLRTLVDYTMSPVKILEGLNRRLVGRTDGGFATCIVLHVRADGEVSMANAGHLAPFLNGEELPLGGTLPLGVTARPEFEESRFHLAENDEVTLYTDGVLEAMQEGGELFGFARARDLMRGRPSVQVIAETAKAFGQKDDITTVKIVRVHEADTRDRMSVDLQTVGAVAVS